MPKTNNFDPKKVLKAQYPMPQAIKSYVYNKTLKDELKARNLNASDAKEIFWQMQFARKFDEMLLANNANGNFKGLSYEYKGPLHVSIGQEAVAIGQAWLLDKHDFVFGSHRNHAEVLAKGLVAINKSDDEELLAMMKNHHHGKIYKLITSEHKFKDVKATARFFFLYSVLAEIFTKETGLNKGMGGSMHMFFTPLGIYPNNAVVGAAPSIASGAALYKLINQKPGVVIANFGDGALSCGPVWESANFMAMDQYKELWSAPYNKRPPFIINLINNLYAMGARPDGETLGNKGSARFGMAINPEQMHAERINGQDVLAVIDAQRQSNKDALNGDGPIFKEFISYRYNGHSSADGTEPYRVKEEVLAWKKFDPIDLFKNQLIANEIMQTVDFKNVDDEIDTLILNIFKLAIDNQKSPFVDWQNNDQVLDEFMLDSRENVASQSDKKVEMSQSLEDNPRLKKLKNKSRYAFDQNGQEVSPLRQYQIRDAIFEAVAQYSTHDPTLIIYGQEHRDWGGPYAVWQGMTELLPYHRFFNALIGEAAIVGSAIGYAMCGGKALVEIMYFDFLFRAGDEISNQMAKWRAMSGGMLTIPMVLRVNIGANYGAQHSQDYSSVIAHIPGLKMVSPVTPYDAKGLMKAALDDPNPVVFVETQNLYGMGERFVASGVPHDEYSIKIGEPIIRRVGGDITILSLGSSLYPALEAATILARDYQIEAEVIDARSSVPFNYDLVLKSLQKTGKILLINNGVERNNFMRHMASTISELAFDALDASPVVLGARNWIMPGAGLDKWIYPQADNILAAINQKIMPLKNFVAKRNETYIELLRRNKKGV